MTREEVLAAIQKAKDENVMELWLNSKSITELPAEIAQLDQLRTLVLDNNQLQTLPVEIGQLTQLQELYLSNNQLQTLPAEIAQLTQLQALYLDRNQLRSIPVELGQLRRLKRLNIGHNKLRNIPIEIARLSDLDILSLYDNKLQSIPIEVEELSSLQGLYLSGNDIQTIPVEIGKLTQLDILDLSNNQLQTIPVELATSKNLILLDLRKTPCSLVNKIGGLIKQGDGVYVPAYAPQIPDELLQKHGFDIYSYLANTLKQKNRPLNEAKLVLVGEGAVGKTSLVNRLIFEKYNAQEIKTEGINRQIWRLPLNEIEHRGQTVKEMLRVNVWDFGGQEIMHATHQFFLTKRSVYLLVLDARRGEQESRLEYWLKLIHSFGGDSPIIVVINKSDEHNLELNKRFLQSKYPNIQAFCNISCKTADGIAELKQIITDHIAANPDVKTALPKTWFELKGKLESLSENYIDYAEYEKLCESQDITDEDSQKTLIGLLHDLGIVLNFQDDERFDRLKETNVLNPAWVTEGVYKILNNIQLFQQKGRISLTDLSTILDLANYPTRKEHQFIMDMMQKFELCFPFEDNHTFLIPELLQKEEPDTNWDQQNSLAFQYHYDILPPSVISRFIVRMHNYISKQTYWRTGVVLQYENNKSLIRADIEDKKIFIWVDGNDKTKRNLLAIIRRDFEHIHSTIKGLKIAEKVPYKTALIDYQHLLNLEKMGEITFIPEGLGEKVNVQKLLDGIESERKELTNSTENKSAKSDEKKEEKTGYLKYKGEVIVGLSVGFILLVLIGKFYYEFDNKEIATILKEQVAPFFDAWNDLTDSKDEKDKK